MMRPVADQQTSRRVDEKQSLLQAARTLFKAFSHSSTRLLVYSSTLLLLTACGFHPMYGTQSAAARNNTAQLSNVHVNFIKDEVGQALRNAIMDRMPVPAAAPQYQLNISTTETQIGIALTSDNTITRQQLRDTLHAELYDTRTQMIVWKQDLFATSGYNILNSQFSTLVGQQDAQERNVNDLSERLVNMLGLFFDRPADEQKLPPPPAPNPHPFYPANVFD